MNAPVFGGYHRYLLPLLVVVETGVLSASMYFGAGLRFGGLDEALDESLQPLWPKALLFASLGIASLVATGLYNRRLRDALPGVIVRLAMAMAFTAVAMMLAFYLVPDLFVGRGAFVLTLATAFSGLIGVRALYLGVMRHGNNSRRVLVLGAGRRARNILRFRRKTDFIGVHFLGFALTDGDELGVPESRLVTMDRPLSQFAAANAVDQVVIAVDDRRSRLPMDELLKCRTHGIDVIDLPSFLEREIGLLKLDVMDPGWLIFSPGFNHRMLRLWVKRLFDIVASLVVLAMTLPVMLLTVVAIWIESGGRGPILYRQARVGQEGIPFELLKFRSMRVDAEADGQARWASANDTRVTRVGAFIRRYRIDELPQLFNVLAGRMSFVGPRPERPQFVDTLTQEVPYYTERHRVKPGLTGWAQIRYPYGASERDAFEKLQYDLYYAKNHNLLLDFGILLQTVEVVLWGKGAR